MKNNYPAEQRNNKRTGNVQTERTATGIITTAEEIVQPKKGKPYKQWAQIGYTSVTQHEVIDLETGKVRVFNRTEGLVGHALASA